MDEDRLNNLINLLNEKEILLKEREIALEDQQEEFLSQKEELTAAVEELMSKNSYLTSTLQKLKQRNYELEDILYRASHDLKTPVSSIYGLIEILQAEPMSHDQRLAMAHLFQQTRQMEVRLMSLTNLSIAFFNGPVVRTFSIHGVVNQTWESIDFRHFTKMQLVGADHQLRTDPGMVSIALKCLMENSITYRDTSVPGRLELSCQRKSNAIEIVIRDDGEGIDAAIQGQIFDMFYRGSERAKGFGLGLYIAKTIVEKLNGTIEYIPSEPQTTFRLTLPAGD